MRYYIADLHFFHNNLNKSMDCRGFADEIEMNEYMINKWNNKVKMNDEVIILGDLSLGNAKDTSDIIARLKGRLFLITGNHDRYLTYRKFDNSRFEWIKPYAELYDDKRKVVLSHYPIICYNGQYRLDEQGKPKTYMLYGHVHDTEDERLIDHFQEYTRNTTRNKIYSEEVQNIPCNMINCFCMFSNYEPLSLDEWIEVDTNRRKK